MLCAASLFHFDPGIPEGIVKMPNKNVCQKYNAHQTHSTLTLGAEHINMCVQHVRAIPGHRGNHQVIIHVESVSFYLNVWDKELIQLRLKTGHMRPGECSV